MTCTVKVYYFILFKEERERERRTKGRTNLGEKERKKERS